MQNVIGLVKSLSKKEFDQILERCKKNENKIIFLQFCRKSSETTDEEALIKTLNFEQQRAKFNTLKHRVIDLIIAEKIKKIQSPLIIIENRVSALKHLIFTDNLYLIKRELNYLYRKSLELEYYEIFEELLSIGHFSEQIFQQKIDLVRIIQKKHLELLEKKKECKNLKQYLFDFAVSELPIFYYNQVPEKYLQNLEAISAIKNKNENSYLALFVFYFLETNLNLSKNNTENQDSIKDQIIRLENIYANTHIRWHLPNFEISILSLKILFAQKFNQNEQMLCILSKLGRFYDLFSICNTQKNSFILNHLLLLEYIQSKALSIRTYSSQFDKFILLLEGEKMSDKDQLIFIHFKAYYALMKEDYRKCLSSTAQYFLLKKSVRDQSLWIHLHLTIIKCNVFTKSFPYDYTDELRESIALIYKELGKKKLFPAALSSYQVSLLKKTSKNHTIGLNEKKELKLVLTALLPIKLLINSSH